MIFLSPAIIVQPFAGQNWLHPFFDTSLPRFELLGRRKIQQVSTLPTWSQGVE